MHAALAEREGLLEAAAAEEPRDTEEHGGVEELVEVEEHIEKVEHGGMEEDKGIGGADVEEHGEMEVGNVNEELAGEEELVHIVKGKWEVVDEAQVGWVLQHFAGGGKLLPHDSQALQKSSPEHVVQGQQGECSLKAEAPWPGAAVLEEQCPAEACPCPSSCPS
uniref:Uncharacterized protein n=1 Tax=Knipowitschia caucasica TaxID=637954 RepID=A0AAV2LDN5_KNICA